jgi:iron complex transport system substrate-binding protein
MPSLRATVAAAALALAWAAAGGRAQAREVVDATGARVRLADKPARIVTLAPSLGELAADLCGNDLSRIVGVSEYTDYPPALAKVASVGQYARFNLEKVVALRPELVLATLDGNPRDEVLHLRELGVPVVVVATASLKDVEGSIRLVGEAMGVPEDGARMARSFAEGLTRIRAKAASGAKARRVLLELGEDPLVVAGRGTFLDDALLAVGATNVYGDSDTHYPRPSLEDVVHRDPDVILVLALGGDLKPFEAMAKGWARFPRLKASRSGNVRIVQDNAVLRPTLRLLEGLRLLEKAVYGAR